MKIIRSILGLAALTVGLHAQAQNDVGSYSIEKNVYYNQSSASALTLDPDTAYTFTSNIDPGTSGALFVNATLTPPAGGTGTVTYTTGANGLSFTENFTEKAALDATFPSGVGAYNLTLQTTTPNNYSDQISFGSDNYPAIPQITSVTNATWSGGHLQVADITQPVTITWNNPSGASADFHIDSTSFTGFGPTSFTIPANSLSNNTFYTGEIRLDNFGGTNSNTIPGPGGNATFQTEVNFNLQTGTPSTSASYYLIRKDHVLVQTTNNVPVDSTYSPSDKEYNGPYDLSIGCPVSGTVTGPSSILLAYTAEGDGLNPGRYQYWSGPEAGQAALDSVYPDGAYTFPGGVQVSLTGDSYPTAPQIVSVNGATPVWNAQGQLVLNPAIGNVITWSSVTVSNFATNGYERAILSSIEQSAGVIGGGATSPFTTLTISAGTLTTGDTYSGVIAYSALPSFSNPSANVYEGALFETGTEFTAVAASLTGVSQAITFPALNAQQVVGAPVTLNATASSGLPVTYIITGPASLSGNTLSFTGTGTVTVEAEQTGTTTYAAATPMTQTLNVVDSTVGNYSIQKVIEYSQSSASAPTLGTPHPYEFMTEIDPGTSGALVANATLTPPAGGTGTVSYWTGPGGDSTSPDTLFYEEQFTSKAAMDAAFPSGAGTYNFFIQTTTPNSYSDQISFGADNYPAAPQITSVTNATWSGGYLVVTDITQPVTINWNNPGGTGAGITIGSLSGNGPSSYTIPANSLANNSYYSGEIFWANGGGTGSTNSNTIAGASGGVLFSAAVNFTIQTGTPSAGTSTYLVEKEHVVVQTANSAPVDGAGGPVDFEYAPYNLRIQSPVSGSVTGPSSTSFPLSFATDYEYSSGPLANLSALNSTAPDGTYTFPGGLQVGLTGDGYPTAPQVLFVNGGTPVWDAQGYLVLNPAISNTISWSSVTVPNFATSGQENASFFAFGGTFSSVGQKAGVNQSSTTPFTSITIPANTMTPGDTYGGKIRYFAFSTFSNPSTNVFDEGAYVTATEFYATATLPAGLLQTIAFPAIANQQYSGTQFAFALNATASSGLPVSYSLISGPATLSGTNNNTVTVTGAGTVVLQASQAGNSLYATAPNVQQSFTVSQDTQTITFPAVATQPYLDPNSPITLNATASSGLPVSYTYVSGPATLSGTNNNTVTVTGTGTITIQANQTGNGSYQAATPVQQSFQVSAPVGFTGDPTATPFNDGVPNLLKYLYDINPSTPMSATDRAALPTVGATTVSGTQYLTLTYRQYALETGITINVQTSPDLINWTTVSPPDLSRQVGTDPITLDPIMEVGVVMPPNTTKQFIRLNVSSP